MENSSYPLWKGWDWWNRFGLSWSLYLAPLALLCSLLLLGLHCGHDLKLLRDKF
jgi:hypothetical protein